MLAFAIALPALLQPATPVRPRGAVTLLSAATESAAFQDLLAATGGAGGGSTVELGMTADSDRGLVAKRQISSGGVVLQVPASLLITAHRSGVVGGLIGQTDVTSEACGDLREEVGEQAFRSGATWDVRLAVGVFEATAGCAGAFWDEDGHIWWSCDGHAMAMRWPRRG